ncbi:MAG: serine/threonine-protein kinase, partial [Bacteroidota bacterium]|nr:serine/threonine-protein kinase [Bacteroidota bacterium]
MPTVFSVAGSIPYLVMPHFHRGSLRGVISRQRTSGPVREEEIIRVCTQVASAMSYLHRNSFVHQDIVPENILLDDDGRWVISDFGFSRILHNTLGHTFGPNRIFHEPYASPERFVSRSANAPDDVFSLGVILYELAVGRLPWEGRGGRALLDGEIPPLSWDDQYSEELQDIVFRCLSKRPEQRPTASELEQWASGYSIPTAEEIRRSREARKRREQEQEEENKRRIEAIRIQSEIQQKERQKAENAIREALERERSKKAGKNHNQRGEAGSRSKHDLKAREEAERKAREEAERRAREEAERKAREEIERKAREEAERKAREEAERRAREEAERKAREEIERKA